MAGKRKQRNVVPAPSYPACVRELKARKDSRLRHYCLCDACAGKWTRDAFDGNAPLWASEPISGYCGLCNARTTVRIRTWFLCDICHRVAASIGRNHVAEQAILRFWDEQVLPQYPFLKIVQNDPSALRPRRAGALSGEGPLDFLVTDERTGRLAFGIENKTGRSALREMSAFQLDLSDCDAILHHVSALAVPAYVIHAQVLETWDSPPTVGFRAVGLWWSDIYALAEQFRDTRMRRDEQRGAAFFQKSAFQPIDTLPAALVNSAGRLPLVERFVRDGSPQLYRLAE